MANENVKEPEKKKIIEKLTPEQEAYLPIYREEVRALGLRCGHTKEYEVQGRKAIDEAYASINMPPPKMVLWAESPIQAIWFAWMMKRLPQEDFKGVRGRKPAPSVSPLGADGKPAWPMFTRSYNELRVQQPNMPRKFDEFVKELNSTKEETVAAELLNMFSQWWMFGQAEMYWLKFYRFAIDIGVEVAPENDAQLNIMERLAEVCYMALSWDDLTIFVKHPKSISCDDERRLHSVDKAALEFDDGYGVFSVRGVRVPPEWILDKANLKPETALTHTNIEERRAAAEIIGWAKVLKALPNRVIQTDPDPSIGELIEVDLPNATAGGKPEPTRFLRVLCGTGREFAVCVPAVDEKGVKLDTARQANAWTYFLSAEEYNPEVRT